MITIPKVYARYAGTRSQTFAVFLIAIAIQKGYPFKRMELTADKAEEARILNQVADWLVDNFPIDFKRGD